MAKWARNDQIQVSTVMDNWHTLLWIRDGAEPDIIKVQPLAFFSPEILPGFRAWGV